MNSLWLLTKKNLRLLIRAKGSALVVVLAPLLLMLILGLSFDTSDKFGLNIGVYSPSFGGDATTFMETLQADDFKVVKYESSIDECIDDIKFGFVHTCISLPETFTIEGNTPKEITFHVDPSRINLVFMIEETVRSKLNLKSQQISELLSRDVLTRLMETKNTIDSEKGQISVAKEKTSTAAGSNQAVKSNLEGLDLTSLTIAYDSTVVDSFKSGMDSEISKSKSKINSAKSSVSSSDLTAEEKDEITDLLNDASSSIGNIDNLLADGSTSVPDNETNETVESSGFTSVSDLVNQMQAEIVSTRSKLAAASTSVISTTGSLDTAGSSLQESISALESVENSLSTIQTNLEGQKVTEAGVIANPLVTKVERIGEGKTYLNYMFSALIVLVIMFSSLLLGTTLVMMEKTSPAFMRNFFLPIRKASFILSTYLTNLIIIAIQLVVILALSLLYLKEILTSLPSIALVLFLAASVFTFLGMVIGYIFVSEETATLASISLGSLLLFVSGVILPLESMSPIIREITSFNPFVLAEKLIREIFIFNSSLVVIWKDVVLLAGYAVILFIVILFVESVLHKHLVSRFLRHHHKSHRNKDKMKKEA